VKWAAYFRKQCAVCALSSISSMVGSRINRLSHGESYASPQATSMRSVRCSCFELATSSLDCELRVASLDGYPSFEASGSNARSLCGYSTAEL
jgi:hypothetical protein